MATKTDVCNLALGHVGINKALGSYDQNSPEAILCRRFYPVARDRTLRRADWWFARSYGDLAIAPSTVVPFVPFTYVYMLPANCIRFWAIEKTKTELTLDRQAIPYKLTRNMAAGGGLIHTDRQNARGIWSISVDNPETYDAEFVHALSWALAEDISMPARKDPAVTKNANSMFEQCFAHARSDGENEEPDRDHTFDDENVPDWMGARG